MRILISPDKFKDALSAGEAAAAIEQGIKNAYPEAETVLLPLADGGEGTSALLTRYNNGRMQKTVVHGPLGAQVTAHWGYAACKEMAFLELAQASGLELLPLEERNPLLTSTHGTGELVNEALRQGARQIILGLGGSATNDGGTGMAAALGYRFLGEKGKEICFPSGKDLVKIRHIENSNVNPFLKNCRVIAACDVENPLLGPKGAVYTFAPQKGAKEHMLARLEEGMSNLVAVINKDLGKDVAQTPGSGAAGGMGAAVLAFADGELCSGAALILEHSGFMDVLPNVDLLITGEGSLDSSSLEGKLISSLCRNAKKFAVPVIAFCGKCTLTQDQIQSSGLKDVIPVSEHEPDLQSALRHAAQNIQEAVSKYFLNNPY